MPKFSMIIALPEWKKFSEQKKAKMKAIAEKYESEITIEDNKRSIGYDSVIHLISNVSWSEVNRKEWEGFSREMRVELGKYN